MQMRTFVGSLLALSTLVLTACSGGSAGSTPAPTGSTGESAANQTQNVLRVGIDATFPPNEFKNEKGEMIGFDIDYAKALAAQMGKQLEFVDTAWEGIIPGLQAKRFDVIISSMNITEKRQEQVDFVPYFSAGQIIVVRPENTTIKSPADLAGKVVGVQLGTSSEEAAKKIAGIKDLKTYNAADAFQDLAANRLDAVIVDDVVGLYRQTQAPNAFKVVGEAFDKLPVGIAIRKNEPELQKSLLDAVAALKQNGAYGKISGQWFGRVIE